jgi:YebC/PmpR family DNA-binding regulatory protein
MSGHSKWANIKRRKEGQDKKKAKVFHKLARELTVAARMGGSGDPKFNARLRLVMEDARAAEMPKSNIESAVKRGLGGDGGASYDEIAYEGYGPGNAALLIETLTDNRTRTVAEIRALFERHGGSMASPGATAWMFEKKGSFLVRRRAAPEDLILETLMEAGAEDYEESAEGYAVYTAPADFEKLKDAFEKARIPVEEARLVYRAKTPTEVSGEAAARLQTFLDALEDHDDVQRVWINAEFADDETAQVASAAS